MVTIILLIDLFACTGSGCFCSNATNFSTGSFKSSCAIQPNKIFWASSSILCLKAAAYSCSPCFGKISRTPSYRFRGCTFAGTKVLNLSYLRIIHASFFRTVVWNCLVYSFTIWIGMHKEEEHKTIIVWTASWRKFPMENFYAGNPGIPLPLSVRGWFK